MRRLSIACALVCLNAPLAAETPEEVLAAGDRSARERKYADALSAWKRAFERSFPRFRDVEFRFPVDADFLDREGLRAKIVEEFRKEMPDEELLAQQKSLAAFGLLPARFDLKTTMLDLLTEEIGGFYDPDTKRLYLIKEGGAEGEDRRRWWEKLLGTGEEFDPEEQKMILVHEMSHALMDQHHDLLTLSRSAEHDDDMALAVSALIEGEATLTMLVGPKGNRDLLSTPPEAMELVFKLAMPFIAIAGGSTFKKAPRVIRESLLFPYLKGLSFCLSLTKEDEDWKPVDRAFAEPPISTEVILHPEKLGEEAPASVSFPDLLPDLGEGWREVRGNVLGEFAIRLVFSEKPLDGDLSAEDAAEGWNGDFYRLYEYRSGDAGPGGAAATLLAWATTWDTEEDAEEFADVCVEWLGERRGAPLLEAEPATLEPGVEAWVLRAGDGPVSAVIRKGSEACMIDGAPPRAFQKLVKKVSAIGLEPKKFQLRRAKPAVDFRREQPTRKEPERPAKEEQPMEEERG